MLATLLRNEDKDETPADNEKPPTNEFHEAYCSYMLLKVKIKHHIFESAEDLLIETKECMESQKKLRTRVPSDVTSFMTVESAFVLRESIEEISYLFKLK